MNKTIRNKLLSVTINKLGAELSSIKSSSGKEFMWGADPDIWGRHAPVLFPIVGKLADDRYIHEGNTYFLNQHGFARNMAFTLIKEEPTCLSFQLLPTPETKKAYPFEFSLIIHYRLSGNAVEIQYQVENNDLVVMPFSIGAHPAFALNWGKDDRIEDYFLKFEKAETADTIHLDKDSLLSDEAERVLENESVIPLRDDMFNRDALIFLKLKSEKVSLCSHLHKRKLTVDFKDFPYLGIWAKPGAPYVCIEPWHGYVDPAGSDGVLMNKPGIIRLEPGKTFSCMHKIIIEE